MAEHNELGKLGEIIARDWLISNGLEVIEANWKSGKLEVDIIALHDKKLVFIEVKTRENTEFGEPAKSVTRKKQKQIIKAANAYLRENETENECRFDIVSVVLAKGKDPVIEWFEDAFYPVV